MALCVGHTFVPRPTRPTTCLICHNEYNKKWMKAEYALVKEASSEYKLSQGCATCGYCEDARALQYDHINPVGRTGRSAVVRMKQLLKVIEDPNIQVLCANCHSIKSHEEGSYTKKRKYEETV